MRPLRAIRADATAPGAGYSPAGWPDGAYRHPPCQARLSVLHLDGQGRRVSVSWDLSPRQSVPLLPRTTC